MRPFFSRPSSLFAGAASLALAFTLAACGSPEDAQPTQAALPETPVVLPNGETIEATPVQADLEHSLAQGEAVGKRFTLASVSFAPTGELQQNPPDALEDLAAILNAYPDVQVQIEATAPPPRDGRLVADPSLSAARVAQVLISQGVDDERVGSDGAVSETATAASVDLIVIARIET